MKRVIIYSSLVELRGGVTFDELARGDIDVLIGGAQKCPQPEEQRIVSDYVKHGILIHTAIPPDQNLENVGAKHFVSKNIILGELKKRKRATA